jgi:molybdopterin-guanine dinucleotide biosynthesis protein A
VARQRGVTTAVVLAGGPPDALAALEPGAANKAFLRIGSVTLVERTIRALRASRAIDRIIVVAPSATHNDPALALADEARPDGEKITISLRNGLHGLAPDELALVSMSDLPILTAASIDDFVAQAHALDPDIGYGCLEQRVHLASYPTFPHTWVRLREGTFCGGGFIAIKPRVLPRLERFIERLGAARKNPLRLASLFGWDILARFAIGRLPVEYAERRASQLLGARARAIISPYAETGINIDRISDVHLAEDLLSSSDGYTPASRGRPDA